jgi:arylsulfatase A
MRSVAALALLASVTLLFRGVPPAAAQETRPPNIVLILADDLGYEGLSSNGSTSYHTPNLDDLAASGMRFERAYAMPLCTPTRSLLMTGRFNFRNYEQFGHLKTGEQTFANFIHDAGYATAMVGKWQLAGDEQTPHQLGFDEYLLWQLHQGDYWARHKNPILTRSGSAHADTLTGKYAPDLFVDFIGDFIDRHKDAPFLVYFTMVLPHTPYQPPPSLPEYSTHDPATANDTAYFAPTVAYMDALVGRVVKKLDEAGVRENTLLIFVGDNGTGREITSRMGDRLVHGDKGYTTDAGIHVPMVASWPAVMKDRKDGRVRGEMVDIVDLFPTLLDAAGAKSPGYHTDGITLYPTLRNGARHAREVVVQDYHSRTHGPLPIRQYALDERFKLYSNGELYDYLADPLEQKHVTSATLTPEARKSRTKLQKALEYLRAEVAAAGKVWGE